MSFQDTPVWLAIESVVSPVATWCGSGRTRNAGEIGDVSGAACEPALVPPAPFPAPPPPPPPMPPSPAGLEDAALDPLPNAAPDRLAVAEADRLAVAEPCRLLVPVSLTAPATSPCANASTEILTPRPNEPPPDALPAALPDAPPATVPSPPAPVPSPPASVALAPASPSESSASSSSPPTSPAMPSPSANAVASVACWMMLVSSHVPGSSPVSLMMPSAVVFICATLPSGLATLNGMSLSGRRLRAVRKVIVMSSLGGGGGLGRDGGGSVSTGASR